MAAEHPRISVIVPVYKVERYIERFMASLCESLSRVSPDGVEVVIVDDGSPDDSAALISAFLREHPVRQSIRIIHQPNGGLSSARNRGMAEARGCWRCGGCAGCGQPYPDTFDLHRQGIRDPLGGAGSVERIKKFCTC